LQRAAAQYPPSMPKRKSAKQARNGHATSSSVSGKVKAPRLRPIDDDEERDASRQAAHEKIEAVKRATAESSEAQTQKRKIYQTRRAVFAFGTLIGLLLTVYFTTNTQESLLRELEKLVNYDSVSGILDDWKDMLPVGIQSMIAELDVSSSNKEEGQLQGSADSFSVGKRMATKYGLHDKYNVIMVPGVISTGIESWGLSGTTVPSTTGNSTDTTANGCPLEPYFRKRLWGLFFMLRTMILDKTCWLKHIMLDPETGLDPPNIKLRAAQGFEAADFFLAGYWIWNKILQNLAVIGYGPNNMLSALYDWRLAYLDLQVRDGYFSKLKNQVEMMYELNGEKSVLVGHSMGSQVIYYFMKWVEAKGPGYGNGGSNWCNKYLSAMVDILGLALGAPKAMTALLLGEMKDTVQLNALAVYGLEKFFSRKERVDMLRTFGGIPSMFPKGGELIWGNLTYAPDDPINTLLTNEVDESAAGMEPVSSQKRDNDSFGTFIRFRPESKHNSNESNETKVEADGGYKNLTMSESIDFLLDHSPDWFANRVREQYSFGIARTKKELHANNQLHSKWSNPLEAALPYAPDMKIYCFYGVGNPTERAYAYQKAEESSKLEFTIDTDSENPVYFGDGDGTVSLLTHTMCHEWQKGSKSRYNPGNSSVTIVEMKHEPDRFDIRGGAKTAEHVDILGSAELNELVLRVASGTGDSIENRYISNLQEIVKKLDI
jgi:phospholipid:diacylglycerol acyltransferase